MPPRLLREMRSLESLISTLNGPEDLSRALREVVDSIVRWSGADRVALLHFEGESREIRHFLGGGPGGAALTAASFTGLTAGLSAWSLRTGEVALSPKNEPDPRESPEVQQRREGSLCGSILVAPIGSAENRLGTITVINRPDQADFTQENADNLGLFAHFAGTIIRLALEHQRTAEARAEAAAAVRSKTHFLSNLSHELRTPLNGVLGFSHLLEASRLDGAQKTMVQAILQSGQRLLATVDNLLELAQFETGQFHLENAPFSPRAVLDSVVAKHVEAAAQKRLEWKISSSPDLPLVLEGDAIKIGQAWNQVLSNAVKFTEQGSITVNLESHKTARGRSELVLNVADTGIGLADERSGRWFRPFHQEDGSLTRKFGGTGLGLALCDRIVREMGGGLSLCGTRGEGTRVRVWVDLGPSRNHRRSHPPKTRSGEKP